MRLLLVSIIIPFHLLAQKTENPYADLGEYIYASLRLYNCSCYWQGATFQPETVRKNRVRSITLPCDSQNCCWKEIWFDTLGRVSGYHKEDDVYFFYDDSLATKGIQRVKCVLRHIDPFEYADGPCDSTIFVYDSFGNIIGMTQYCFYTGYPPIEPAVVSTFSYHNDGRRSEVIYTFISNLLYSSLSNMNDARYKKPILDTTIITYRLDRRSRKLTIQYGSTLNQAEFILRKPHIDPYRDTLHDFEEDFGIVDTIPDGRYYSLLSDAVPYHLHRDAEGKILSVLRDYGKYQEGWSFEYDRNGLPVSLAYYWTDPDSGQTVERQKYIYQYY